MLQGSEIEWGKQSRQFSRESHFTSDELRSLQPYYPEFLAAYAVLIISPVILFALTANRYVVSGMTAGAVKG